MNASCDMQWPRLYRYYTVAMKGEEEQIESCKCIDVVVYIHVFGDILGTDYANNISLLEFKPLLMVLKLYSWPL